MVSTLCLHILLEVNHVWSQLIICAFTQDLHRKSAFICSMGLCCIKYGRLCIKYTKNYLGKWYFVLFTNTQLSLLLIKWQECFSTVLMTKWHLFWKDDTLTPDAYIYIYIWYYVYILLLGRPKRSNCPSCNRNFRDSTNCGKRKWYLSVWTQSVSSWWKQVGRSIQADKKE